MYALEFKNDIYVRYLSCVLTLRQAREIVLKYEGRLTRTRGYQTAGADVRTNPLFVVGC